MMISGGQQRIVMSTETRSSALPPPPVWSVSVELGLGEIVGGEAGAGSSRRTSASLCAFTAAARATRAWAIMGEVALGLETRCAAGAA